MSSRTLLVEGYTDTLLMKSLIKKLGISDVECYPPKDLGSKSNGISNVISLIPSLMVKIKSGDIDSFGILVDADYAGFNGGFNERKSEIEAKLLEQGYTEIPTTSPNQFGSEYICENYIPIHVAILPNHSGNGMIENLLLNAIPPGEFEARIAHARSSIASLPTVHFNSTLHMAKAELATYLSWDKNPGCDAGLALKYGSLNFSAPALDDLKNWLIRIFP